MTTKRTSSFRLSDMTIAQINMLIFELGMSRTELLTVAIDRMYQQHKPHHAEIDDLIPMLGDIVNFKAIAEDAEELDSYVISIPQYVEAGENLQSYEEPS